MNLDYEWQKETFDLIRKCVLKRYNAELYSQSAFEAALEMKKRHAFSIDEIEKINLPLF